MHCFPGVVSNCGAENEQEGGRCCVCANASRPRRCIFTESELRCVNSFETELVPLIACYSELGEAWCVWETRGEGVGVCRDEEGREGEWGILRYLLGDLRGYLFCEVVPAGFVTCTRNWGLRGSSLRLGIGLEARRAQIWLGRVGLAHGQEGMLALSGDLVGFKHTSGHQRTIPPEM
jgi:hypothetical protein